MSSTSECSGSDIVNVSDCAIDYCLFVDKCIIMGITGSIGKIKNSHSCIIYE
jgi:hypothetical protein